MIKQKLQYLLFSSTLTLNADQVAFSYYNDFFVGSDEQ